jgi:hypothetical protein
MKKINLLLLLTMVSFGSCTKKEEVLINNTPTESSTRILDIETRVAGSNTTTIWLNNGQKDSLFLLSVNGNGDPIFSTRCVVGKVGDTLNIRVEDGIIMSEYQDIVIKDTMYNILSRVTNHDIGFCRLPAQPLNLSYIIK